MEDLRSASCESKTTQISSKFFAHKNMRPMLGFPLNKFSDFELETKT